MRQSVLASFDDRFFYEEAIRPREAGSLEDYPLQVINRILYGEHPIKVFREYRRYTQEQLGRKVGASTAYIDALEKGKLHPTQDVLRGIARLLRVRLDEIA